MPTRVVAVKRSPRRAFELIRRAPAWLRAIFVATRSGRGAQPETDRPRSALLAFERASGVAVPAWIQGGDPAACVDCARCVEGCPARALTLRRPDEVDSDERDASISLFLHPGSCIGCGDCLRICPANLLTMETDSQRVGEGARPVEIDLVIQTASRQQAGTVC